eukprot:CAMPEP_0197885312 /NCGR_PEP_ID=MMETSP1439-20131203/13186_1 /TAXON_ID=66791 /ORGANISM="Gonyaulax spinifera, Strain CCMP409" /LENGTH=184 /DNA_ID=CAMNT_0043505067 /DNA_START=49 /DNA_END=603 /DNA_ORIENTATION=-
MAPLGLLQGACRLAVRRVAPAPLRLAPAAALRQFGSGHDPRGHLNPDGTRPELEDIEGYHDPDPMEHRPKQNLIKERGQTWIVSHDPPKSTEELHGIPQVNNPFWARQRLLIWGNYKLLMKAEYLFFYIPTVIILGLCIPAFTTIYALEEAVASTMTVKITGRQWYWVYEVESPTDDGEEEDDE